MACSVADCYTPSTPRRLTGCRCETPMNRNGCSSAYRTRWMLATGSSGQICCSDGCGGRRGDRADSLAGHQVDVLLDVVRGGCQLRALRQDDEEGIEDNRIELRA